MVAPDESASFGQIGTFTGTTRFQRDATRIVALGVTVEQAEGDRIPWPNAALRGMITGAIVGLFSGWAVGQFAVSPPVAWITILICSVVVAAFTGGVLLLLLNSQKKVSAEPGSCVSAKRFDVMIPKSSKMEAEKIMARRL